MKTSNASRLEEWTHLNLLAINGRLVQWPEIKRWQVLRKEFLASRQTGLKPLKTVETQ